ncbi:MAG: hypothetical protein DI535_21425 [Citrobacter freundii]|nr:MAG: hypothetical protein DI535_21425 [Citrobacter freundii]
MQRIAALILFVAFLGQTFDQGFCYIGYVINKAEYMRNCENKYRPMLHCDGKCQLMKKIDAQRKKDEQQAPELKLAAKSEAISSRSSFLLNAPGIFTDIIREYLTENTGKPVDRASSFFHPPNC